MYMQLCADGGAPAWGGLRVRAARKQKRVEAVPRQSGCPVAFADLGDCACLRLRKITRRVTQLFDHFLQPSGLTTTQFSLLGFIEWKDRIAIGELAAMLVTDPTTLTRNLRPLERLGYVEIVADPKDRRRRTIALTAKGEAVLREAAPLWRQAQARVVALVGEQRSMALKTSLDQALERLGSE
jgi:DNA-binding MarR family transcriptional regulator